jgi:hypothetical protein
MQDHLVDEPGRQGSGHDAAAHEGDVLSLVTWLGVSPSKYQSKSMVATPSPRPAPGSRPVMYPSTDTAGALKTCS